MTAGEPVSADEARVAACIEDYRRRRALGEHPNPESYRAELSGCFDDFLDVLTAESFFDEALTVPREFRLPRAFGHYTLERELGRGSAGVVYEALDTHRNERVALKVMRAGFDTDAHARERFLREARACQQVNHLNVVEIYAAGEIEERPYYAMTLIHGETLSDRVRHGEPIAPKRLCRGLAGVAAALTTMHEVGIVHRDVKPSNIIVEKGGRMVLADFGLARMDIASTLTRTGSSLGTPLYMSPEQMMSKREEVDGRSDVYGLGAAMYEALTGRPPFEADDYRTLVPRIISERPLAPSKIDPQIPRSCSRIVLTCLEKDPRDRYANASRLHDDLMAFVDDRPVRGRPVTGVRRALRTLRRNPLPTGIAALALVVIALLWTLLKPAPPPAYLDVRLVRPQTALIFVNGIDMNEGLEQGLRGLEGYELTPGEHTIRCEADGYIAFEDTFRAQAGQTVSYRVSMDMTPELLQEISKRFREQADEPEAPEDDPDK
ncbi:MAG: serine/threonine-protein kinase [Planctomycetota bacterium]|nr:serine/threonine-protein kinase [Planctomycetota bacterium]